MFDTIQLKIEKGIAIAVISRPETLNALNKEVLADLERLIDTVENNQEIKVLIITGDGRAFVAGADIVAQSKLDMEGGRKWGQYGSRIFRRLEKLDAVTIAAINGFALGGGCELAMSCDLRIASTKAKLGQPEVSLGITPGFSGTQRLPRLVGVAKAKELILTGEIISAAEAERIGLVNKLAEPDCLMAEVIEMAKKIIKNAPVAVKFANAAISRGMDVSLDAGIEAENELFAMCFATEDQKEGMKAFVEKRAAAFSGR